MLIPDFYIKNILKLNEADMKLTSEAKEGKDEEKKKKFEDLRFDVEKDTGLLAELGRQPIPFMKKEDRICLMWNIDRTINNIFLAYINFCRMEKGVKGKLKVDEVFLMEEGFDDLENSLPELIEIFRSAYPSRKD